ncbi:MAG: hypothetical protein ACKO8Z_14880 [Prosthecobacter sp.]
MMIWNDWLRVLRWRALEEGDADGKLVNMERRREATAHTRAGLTSEEVKGDALDDRTTSFVEKRSAWLEAETVGWRGDLIRELESLRVPQGKWSWAIAGWIAAMVAGYWMTDLGQEREFNLLALPLVGLLAWNAVVIVLGVLCELMPSHTLAGRGGWLAELLAHGVSRARKSKEPNAVQDRFTELAWPLAWRRLQARMRAWLHVGAAMLALGGVVALYARGWSKEYRAVWESTLLTNEGAKTFFHALFMPAAAAFGTPVPLDKVPEMRRTGGRPTLPAPALPWIHLYAGTLLLLVVVPRLALVGISMGRMHCGITKWARRLSWGPYLRRLLHAVEGVEERVEVLLHGMDPASSQQEVWARGICERFGSTARPQYTRIPAGDEDDFAARWQPAGPMVVMLFNMATTPEAEVQRRLVNDIRQRLLTKHSDPDFIVLLDGTSLGGRWPDDKITGRERLWSQMMEGLGVEVIVALRKDTGMRMLPESIR